MNILICVKRVPDIGAKVELTEDRRAIVTRNLGFTISPHEESGAVEEAVQRIEKDGGESTVLTLGPGGAEEQLRDSLAGVWSAASCWRPTGTSGMRGRPRRPSWKAIQARQAAGEAFDLFLFGTRLRTPGTFRWPSEWPMPWACRA